uniref:C2H2-type domain-containing protein n=1 Tax=Solanum lycopersicum TaxID=4081 RepID=A0A3Q7EYB5_SOLLC
MVIGGEGTSEDRAKRANVEPPVPAPTPAPAPEPSVLERTCYACDMVFDTMILFLRHMQSHQVLETSYVPDLNQDQVPNWTPPYEPIASPDDDNSSDISVDDGTADADADVPAAPREPVYLLPDLNLPAPEEDEDEDGDE